MLSPSRLSSSSPVVQNRLSSTGSGSVRVSRFGTNLAALKSAVDLAQSTKRRLLIDAPVVVNMTQPTDPIRMLDDFWAEWVDGGSVSWDAFGLPLFWATNASNLRLINPLIYFAGTAATSLPASNLTFYNDVLDRNARHFPRGDAMAAIGIFGCDDVEIRNPKLRAADFSSPAKLMQRAISISDHQDGSRSTNVRITGDIELDGTTMGILAWGFQDLVIGSVTTKRWGQLDTSVYTWDVACHAVYITPQFPGFNVTTGPLHDEGTEVPGNVSNYSSHSFKFIDVTGGSVGPITSHRNCGALEYRSRGTAENKFTFAPIEWWGTSAAALTNAGPVNCNGTNSGASGQSEHTVFQSITLHPPDDCETPLVTGANGSVSAVDDPIRYNTYNSIEIYYNGSTRSTSNAFVMGTMSNCEIEVSVFAPNWTVSNALIVRIDGGGDDNVMDITTQGPTFASVRFVELSTEASSGNVATFREFGTANVRTVGPTT